MSIQTEKNRVTSGCRAFTPGWSARAGCRGSEALAPDLVRVIDWVSHLAQAWCLVADWVRCADCLEHSCVYAHLLHDTTLSASLDSLYKDARDHIGKVTPDFRKDRCPRWSFPLEVSESLAIWSYIRSVWKESKLVLVNGCVIFYIRLASNKLLLNKVFLCPCFLACSLLSV